MFGIPLKIRLDEQNVTAINVTGKKSHKQIPHEKDTQTKFHSEGCSFEKILPFLIFLEKHI